MNVHRAVHTFAYENCTKSVCFTMSQLSVASGAVPTGEEDAQKMWKVDTKSALSYVGRIAWSRVQCCRCTELARCSTESAPQNVLDRRTEDKPDLHLPARGSVEAWTWTHETNYSNPETTNSNDFVCLPITSQQWIHHLAKGSRCTSSIEFSELSKNLW